MSLRHDDRAAVDPARMLLALFGALTVVLPLMSLSVAIALRPDSRYRLALATGAAILGWQLVIVALAVTNSLAALLVLLVPVALGVRDAGKSPRDEWKLLAGIYASPAVIFGAVLLVSRL